MNERDYAEIQKQQLSVCFLHFEDKFLVKSCTTGPKKILPNAFLTLKLDPLLEEDSSVPLLSLHPVSDDSREVSARAKQVR